MLYTSSVNIKHGVLPRPRLNSRPIRGLGRASVLARSIASLLGLVAASGGLTHADDGTWTTVDGGSWSSTSDWATGNVADGAGATARFDTLDSIFGTIVTLDSNRTIGRLTFGDTDVTNGAGWTIDGNSILTFSGGTPSITVNALGDSGSATISAQISGSEGLVKYGAGILTLSGTNDYSGGTTISGGYITSGSNFGLGNITLDGGGIRWTNTTDPSAKFNAVGAGGALFDTNGYSPTLATAITGTGAITKNGVGTLTLSGTNTQSGGTIINGGQVTALDTGLGATGSTVVLNGGTLRLNGNVQTLSHPVTVNSTGTITYGTGSNFFTGALHGSGTLTFSQGNGGSNTVTFGLPTGATTDFSDFLGTLLLSNKNFRFDSTYAAASGKNAAWRIEGNSSLTYRNGTNSTLTYELGSLAGTSAAAILSGGGSAGGGTINYRIGNLNTSTDFAGIIQNGSSKTSLEKIGTGTLSLSGVNTYTGGTTVNGGTLLVSGSLTGSAATINASGTLAGSGSVVTTNQAITLNAGAHLSPGSLSGFTLSLDVGTAALNATNAIGATQSGALIFDLDTPDTSDKINLSGLLTIGTGLLGFEDFAFNLQSNFDVGVYTLIDGNTALAINDSLGSNLTGVLGNLQGTLSLSDDRQDLLLTVAAIPEPSSLALLGSALTLTSLWRPRHRS